MALVALPDVKEDAERRARGVTVADWLAAPRPPATRGQCEDGERPCPALRCRHHLGRYGELAGYSCALDVAELPDAERTFDLIARLLAVTPERALQIEKAARHRLEQLPEETLRALGVRRRRP